MGQSSSSYLHAGYSLPIENSTVRDLKVVGDDSQQNATSAASVNVRNNSDMSSSTSTVITPATATVKSSQARTKHLPWFFANMTEEHWERLNMMCIEIPSSS